MIFLSVNQLYIIIIGKYLMVWLLRYNFGMKFNVQLFLLISLLYSPLRLLNKSDCSACYYLYLFLLVLLLLLLSSIYFSQLLKQNFFAQCFGETFVLLIDIWAQLLCLVELRFENLFFWDNDLLGLHEFILIMKNNLLFCSPFVI